MKGNLTGLKDILIGLKDILIGLKDILIGLKEILLVAQMDQYIQLVIPVVIVIMK